MSHKWILVCLVGALAPLVFASDAPSGKKKTDRSIQLAVVVEGTPEHVFRYWIEPELTTRFFGDHAVIEPREGGPYEIYFLPPDHPEGDANSSKGARLLSLEPSSRLIFEWTAPPEAAELNTQPLPMWVEVSLEPLGEDGSRTAVKLSHHGFGRSAQWDATYEFFVRGWAGILYSLDRELALGANGKAH